MCNDPPSLPDLSGGMVRRLMVVPFERTFVEAEQDRTLFTRIRDTELSGILNRAVAGLDRSVGWVAVADPGVSPDLRRQRARA